MDKLIVSGKLVNNLNDVDACKGRITEIELLKLPESKHGFPEVRLLAYKFNGGIIAHFSKESQDKRS